MNLTHGPSVTLSCLKTTVRIGSTAYPVFVTFMSANQILTVAETPQFKDNTPQQSLAQSVLGPNMSDWQRPLDDAKVHEIASVFRQPELMPNPILLAENGNLHKLGITITQEMATNSVPTKVWSVQIDPSGLPQRPLWILDGQHRINGLKESTVQANTDIPVVMLLNDAPSVYTGSILAKIFAQVTTGAEPLNKIHNEWLIYAFKLGQYDPVKPDAQQHRNAMEATAQMCANPQFTVGNTVVPNAFVGNIRFNPELQPSQFAFAYDCTSLKALLYDYYYSQPSSNHQSPITVAQELSRAVDALRLQVMAPQKDSVFFGDSDHAQGIMKDAFIVGVLSRLLSHTPPIDWTGLLNNLQFSKTAWNFKSWTNSLSGSKVHTPSKKIAFSVFTKIFSHGALPTDPLGSPVSIADHLRGNAASVELVCVDPNLKGRAKKNSRTVINVFSGARLSPSIGSSRLISIQNRQGAIAGIRVVDGNARPGRPVHYDKVLKKSGMLINLHEHANPLKLEVYMEFYGGQEQLADVELTWQP